MRTSLFGTSLDTAPIRAGFQPVHHWVLMLPEMGAVSMSGLFLNGKVWRRTEYMSLKGFMVWGCAGWLSPPPLSRTRKREDERPALERPNAREAALDRMFCPSLKMGK